MRKLSAFSCFMCFSLLSLAQDSGDRSGVISGSVFSPSGPIASATIRLLLGKDSIPLRTVVSDTAGQFTIDHLASGNYLLLVEAVGYNKYYSSLLSLTPVNFSYRLTRIQLTVSHQELLEVVIAGHKQQVEQHLDKTVINVDASPSNAGITALDVLEKSPGIALDKDGNIRLNGKPNPVVLIDGKPAYLSPADLVTVLTSMSSAQLDQIEIMTNPSAKYDAAGNAGAINIRTKKIKTTGLNVNASLSGGLGIHARSNNRLDLNYRKGKINFFVNYGYSYSDRKSDLDIYRNIRDQENQTILQAFQTKVIRYYLYQIHTIKSGLDLDISKNTTIGFAVSSLLNSSRRNDKDTTSIFDGRHVLDSLTVSNSNTRGHFNNVGANLNLRHVFDTAGSDLNADLDYIHYASGKQQLFDNFFYDARFNQLDPPASLFGHLPGTLDIFSGKVDYTLRLDRQTSMELGAKSSYARSDSYSDYFDGSSQAAPVDVGLSNHFLYKENINAGYISFRRQFDNHWTAQAGLRLENTHGEGDQQVGNQSFTRNYTQLFPTAYLEYTLNSNNKFGLDYGRRIQRPDYQSMNPFYQFLDKFTYAVGNPDLIPQLSSTLELKHIFRDFLTSSISYSKTDNIIVSLLQQVDSTRIDYQTFGNIATSVNYSASLSFSHSITRWWNANVSVQEIYTHLYGATNSGNLNMKAYTFSTNFNNQFTILHDWLLELSGYYNTHSIDGTSLVKPLGSLNFAVSRKVLHGRGNLRLSVLDFANLLKYNEIIHYQNNDQLLHFKPDSRSVNLAFTYRFSKGKTARQRQHHNASEEEQNRVNAN